MSFPYFFVKSHNIEAGKILLEGEDFIHLVKVLRAVPGDRVTVSDNSGRRYEALLSDIWNKSAYLSVLSSLKAERKNPRITLFQCILKKSAMEMVIQKACEIGADEIIPVISRRVVAKPERKEGKVSRWQKIAEQACKQCKSSFITPVGKPVDLRDISPGDFDIFYLPYEQSSNRFSGCSPNYMPKSAALLVGPEGGFEAEEAELLKGRGAEEISLGNKILRAETASLYMLSVLDYVFRMNHE